MGSARFQPVDDRHETVTRKQRARRPDGSENRVRLVAEHKDAPRIGATVEQAARFGEGLRERESVRLEGDLCITPGRAIGDEGLRVPNQREDIVRTQCSDGFAMIVNNGMRDVVDPRDSSTKVSFAQRGPSPHRRTRERQGDGRLSPTEEPARRP